MKFNVPSNGKKGNLWKVFYVNTDGKIVKVNQIVYKESPSGEGEEPEPWHD